MPHTKKEQSRQESASFLTTTFVRVEQWSSQHSARGTWQSSCIDIDQQRSGGNDSFFSEMCAQNLNNCVDDDDDDDNNSDSDDGDCDDDEYNERERRYPLLHVAVANNNVDEIRHLIRQSNCANVQNSDGVGALHVAAEYGHCGAAAALLLAGANVHLRDMDGVAPLHLAAASGHEDVVRLLARAGANVNVADCDGEVPLHYAVREARIGVAHRLAVELGANVDASSVDQESPLELAYAIGETAIAAMLERHTTTAKKMTKFFEQHQQQLIGFV
jgi:ankyrin repeat protein